MRPHLLFTILLVSACGDDTPPPDNLFDGNVLIGDARIQDARTLDARPDDAGIEDAPGPNDVPDFDVGFLDRGPQPDSGTPPTCSAAPAETNLTASEVVTRALELDGQVVDVVGTATASAPTCTTMACPGFDPCCNSCQADLVVDGVLPLAANTCFMTVGCTGDECSLVCVPFISVGPQTFRGRVATSPTRLLLHSLP